MDLGLKRKKGVRRRGSRGIGLAVARAFAVEGVDVATGARNGDTVEKEAERIGLAWFLTKPVVIVIAFGIGYPCLWADPGLNNIIINNCGNAIADGSDGPSVGSGFGHRVHHGDEEQYSELFHRNLLYHLHSS